MAGEEVVNSDGDLIPVTRGDLLVLWLLAHDALTMTDNETFFIGPWCEEQQELLHRIGEKLDNPCRQCHMSKGVHKMDCSNG
jgi:hypothetical protein